MYLSKGIDFITFRDLCCWIREPNGNQQTENGSHLGYSGLYLVGTYFSYDQFLVTFIISVIRQSI